MSRARTDAEWFTAGYRVADAVVCGLVDVVDATGWLHRVAEATRGQGGAMSSCLAGWCAAFDALDPRPAGPVRVLPRQRGAA